MNKAAWQLLEKVFTADMENALPFQTKSSLIFTLEREGLVQRLTGTFPGRFAVKVEGWGLTQAGHIRYCEWAASQPTPPDAEGEVP